MTAAFDALRWAPPPERALRIAVVTCAAGAVVPALVSFPLPRMIFCQSAVAVWVTLLSTVFFAYGVVRWARPRLAPRASRQATMVGLSILGGGLNGVVAGAVTGQIINDVATSALVGMWGGASGLLYGLIFGLANAQLVAIVERSNRVPSTMSAGTTVTRLALAVASFVAMPLLFAVVDRHGILESMNAAPPAIRLSLGLALLVPVTVVALAAIVAGISARAQSRRRRWLDLVTRGQDARYRVLPCADLTVGTSSSPLALFDGVADDERADVIVRVDRVDDATLGAYRRAEHLTPVARLFRADRAS